MRILFINFNIGATPGINNGLAVLSAVLKQKNHQVDLLFLCEGLGYDFDLERIKGDILKIDPSIIGISLMEPQAKYAKAFCKDLRNYYKGFLICGGPYPTMAPEDVLAIEGVNAVCVGEGEDAMSELVEALEAGKGYGSIMNLWLKLPDGRIIKNNLRPFRSLDDLPPEDKELFDLDRILPVKNYQLEMMVGRGCAYKCSYCINESYINQYNKLCDKPISVKEYLRIKSADTIICEIKNTLLRHPQIKKIAFIDDNFLTYRNFINTFSQKYKNEIGLPFMCNGNPMSFDAAKGKKLKEAGCDDIRFGVESGNERIKRDIMKRPISNQSVISAFKLARGLGTMTSSFNMIGLPTETKDEVFETLKLNALISPDTIKLVTFYPFRNTPIYDLCVKLNLIDEDRKKQLDSFDTSTCLKFDPGHQLFLKKVQTAFNWYINSFLENESSPLYLKLIDKIEGMSEEEWDGFDFYSVDEEVSRKLKNDGILHYSKFVNRSLAVKFPSKHLSYEKRC